MIHTTSIFQADSALSGIPDPGTRISVWVIGMFLLAVGGMFLWIRVRGFGNAGRGPSGTPRNDP